ncbi:hypothetical protein BC835DRAFT_147026 [Cytidiella melzeri]|nr:hypothetical protein BC835DRAFT_147026 [Cytidiella melzeri]
MSIYLPSTMSKQLTLYTSTTCPYAQRVEIALAEAKNAKFTRYEIDLSNKPEWYAPKVNPASKVPAITYGGPEVPPDQPSPDSVKLNESLVLVEFIADLYPESGILPQDPVLRAKARLFINTVNVELSKVEQGGGTPEVLIQAFESFQAHLPPKGFAVGEFSIADIALAPVLLRTHLRLRHDLGPWKPGQGEGQKVLNALQEPTLARFWQYVQDLQTRPSVVATWREDLVLPKFEKRFRALQKENELETKSTCFEYSSHLDSGNGSLL